jgi:hypothetical protein
VAICCLIVHHPHFHPLALASSSFLNCGPLAVF